jgi:undecaprenyl phosphate N,N'-diacetylbacillosamine 1-phosphate transferase
MQTEVSSNTVQHVNNGGVYRRYIKRPMDLILSLCAIIVLAPVLLIIAILVRIKLGSPVLFKQKRPGLNEKIFTLYKFRTMTDERDENGELLPDEIRLTRFGKLLRSTSLDELPELFNIIKGDMSIVGPRPLLIQYLPLYDDHQKRRHEVRPGLSGLAMAKGRNALTWEEKFAYDTYYANHVSFLLDVKIIFWTMAIVFKREGINEAGHASVSEFMGSNKETGVEFK